MTTGNEKDRKSRQNEIQQLLRLYQLRDPMPKTQTEANALANKLEKTYRTEKRHESYHAFFPFWYYKTTDDGSKKDLILPFLLAEWETRQTGDSSSTDCIVGTPLVFRKKHWQNRTNGYMVMIQDREDIEKVTTHRWNSIEYDQFKLLCWEQEKFRFLFWKNNVGKEEKNRRGSYWTDCGDGKISWDEAAKREKEYYAKNTEIQTLFRNTFLHKWCWLSLRSDTGERRTYLGGGLLAKRETLGDSDDFHVLGFLYRYQKKKAVEREFIFPFILRQKDGIKEKFSFGWHLFSRESENGKCTGGHIFFIPY